LPLITPQTGVFIDIALEGSVSGAPKPTIPALTSVFDKIAELQVKEEKERIKAQASSSKRGYRGRGRGRSTGDTPRTDTKGKGP
jgi:hypothetical protein